MTSMNWELVALEYLKVFASIVASIAWPAALIIGLFMFRKYLIPLFPALQRLKYMGLELEFGTKIRELNTEAGIPSPSPDAGPAFSRQPAHTHRETREVYTFDVDLYQLAKTSQRAAILEAWLQVERAATGALAATGQTSRTYAALMGMGELLKSQGILDEGDLKIFNGLRKLRDRAFHDLLNDGLPHAEVEGYINLARGLVERIRRGAADRR